MVLRVEQKVNSPSSRNGILIKIIIHHWTLLQYSLTVSHSGRLRQAIEGHHIRLYHLGFG